MRRTPGGAVSSRWAPRWEGEVSSCYDATQFQDVGRGITPQPWMQWRQVATAAAAAAVRTYAPTGGGTKNDVLQTALTHYTNSSPLDQWVYGEVTRAGSRVTLQARSRGYLRMSHAMAVGSDPGALVEVSRMGCGLHVGKQGLFATDQFGMTEVRENAISMPLMPHLTGWQRIAAGATLSAKVEVRFVSEFWQSAAIAGGSNSTESSCSAGELRLDLFAIPVIE